MSSEKRTVPATVLTEPGDSVRIPVVASASCRAANRCECRMSLEAVKSASARLERSVVPEWHSEEEENWLVAGAHQGGVVSLPLPLISTVNHR